MNLTPAQQEKLKKLVSQGKSLSDIQTVLQADGVVMTYMQLRFLLDDMSLVIHEKPQLKTVPPMPQASTANMPAGLPEDEEPSMPAGGVTVTMDTVVRPGAVVSGGAIFTDGVKVQWALDQYGRLGLYSAPEGYKPPATDIQEFQMKLRELIESRGGV